MAQRGIACLFALAALAGCAAITEADRIDYKSASKTPGRALDVPPDLTQLQRENRYTIPEGGSGSVTASVYSQQQSAAPVPTAGSAVVPAATSDMRIERAGTQRWLVVRQAPEILWPKLQEFWKDSGFVLSTDAPQVGVMETDWAENRAKIPQDFIRRTIGRVVDSLYSTGERDKFRTRLERGPDGTTEIYISHRGAQEELVGQQKERTIWTSRPSDPELEAEFLSRLMVRLGADNARAQSVVASSAPAAQPPQRSRLVKNAGGSYVEVDEGFDRAWRRVGLALDRVGFTVEDRDRSQGMYFVRYVDQDAQGDSGKGFFSRLFSGSDSDKARAAQRYRVAIKGNGPASQISVLNSEGTPASAQTADRILALLNDQLK